MFANKVRRNRWIGGEPIAKLLQQQRAKHGRWHAIVGNHGKPKWDAGVLRERSVGLECADELPASQIAALYQRIAYPASSYGRRGIDNRRVWRRKPIQSLLDNRLYACSKLVDGCANRRAAPDQRGGGEYWQRRRERRAHRNGRRDEERRQCRAQRSNIHRFGKERHCSARPRKRCRIWVSRHQDDWRNRPALGLRAGSQMAREIRTAERRQLVIEDDQIPRLLGK